MGYKRVPPRYVGATRLGKLLCWALLETAQQQAVAAGRPDQACNQLSGTVALIVKGSSMKGFGLRWQSEAATALWD